MTTPGHGDRTAAATVPEQVPTLSPTAAPTEPIMRLFGEINYPQLDQKTAIQFLDDVPERLPFRMEEVIQLLIHLLVTRTPGERGVTRASSRR